jgi:hypothetical protein
MLTFLTVLTMGMVMTLVAVMVRSDAPPPVPVKKSGIRIRMKR